jgi:hypothetical protein
MVRPCVLLSGTCAFVFEDAGADVLCLELQKQGSLLGGGCLMLYGCAFCHSRHWLLCYFVFEWLQCLEAGDNDRQTDWSVQGCSCQAVLGSASVG